MALGTNKALSVLLRSPRSQIWEGRCRESGYIERTNINVSFNTQNHTDARGSNREVKHDVSGRRQTAKTTSDFELFYFNRK